jgi:hypothetical protein
MYHFITVSLYLFLNKLAVLERPWSFKKTRPRLRQNAVVFFLKRQEVLGVGRKWGGATSTTTSFALIFSDLGAWCWICRRILIFNEENGLFYAFFI